MPSSSGDGARGLSTAPHVGLTPRPVGRTGATDRCHCRSIHIQLAEGWELLAEALTPALIDCMRKFLSFGIPPKGIQPPAALPPPAAAGVERTASGQGAGPRGSSGSAYRWVARPSPPASDVTAHPTCICSGRRICVTVVAGPVVGVGVEAGEGTPASLLTMAPAQVARAPPTTASNHPGKALLGSGGGCGRLLSPGFALQGAARSAAGAPCCGQAGRSTAAPAMDRPAALSDRGADAEPTALPVPPCHVPALRPAPPSQASRWLGQEISAAAPAILIEPFAIELSPSFPHTEAWPPR